MTASPYAPPPGWAVPAPAEQRLPTDGWSVASLVTGLLGLTVVGLVCGVVGLGRTAGGRRRGRGLAVAGLVVSVLVLAAQAALVVTVGPAFVGGVRDGFEEGFADGFEEGAGTTTDGAADPGPALPVPSAAAAAGPVDEPAEPAEPAGQPAGAEVVEVDELAVGDCFDDPPEETFYEITVLPCDVPHDGEVLTTVTLEGERWPGGTEVDDLAWEACQAAVVELLEPAGVDTSGLDYWTFTPTKDSWVLYDDREVQCLVYGLDGPLEAPVLP